MNIAICDNKHEDRETLASMVQQYLSDNLLTGQFYLFENARALLEAHALQSFEILFLEIDMVGISGLDAARRIRETDQNCELIFTTSSTAHALEGFQVNAAGYLVKPVKYLLLQRTLYRCRTLLQTAARYIEIICNRISRKVFIRSILYAEVYGNRIVIHTETEDLRTYLALEEFVTMIGDSAFLRCHRCFVVNLRYVDKLQENFFVLQNGAQVPIKQHDKKEIIKTYFDYLLHAGAKL